MSETKIVFSIYIEERLRRRLLVRASELQQESGRRVSITSIVVEAVEAYLQKVEDDYLKGTPKGKGVPKGTREARKPPSKG